MPYCPNCGSPVEEVHHYCGSCGQALSTAAESEDESLMTIDRDGFLSSRSLSYITDLLNGEREVDRDSPSHKQLQHDVREALADFAILAKINGLNLLLLWASGSSSGSLDTPVEDMNYQQYRDRLASLGLHRVLQFYDNSIGTDLKDEFDDHLNEFIEQVYEESDFPKSDFQ